MNRKQLGKSDIKVSECCLGTMYFGTKVTETKAFSVLDAFLDFGGDFLDTANNYAYWVGGNGEESELLLGKWMQQRHNRDKVVLATKVGAMPMDRNNPESPLEGLRKETIIKGCESSLKRLKTDYIDLFYIHADLKQYPLEERWEALYQLEKSGKIRSKGCSNYEIERLKSSELMGNEICGSGSVALQQKMSYLHPNKVRPDSNLRFVDDTILEYVNNQKISLLTYSVLLSGAYEKTFEDLPEAYQSQENREKFEKVKTNALEQDMTPSQWVLKWIRSKSEQIIPLIAASSTEQLKVNLRAFN